MAKEREYKWYVESRGDIARTHRIIATFLGEEVDDSHSFCNGILCNDGKPHKLWIFANYEQVSELWASRRSLNIRIKVWCKAGGGKIRPSEILKEKCGPRYPKTGPHTIPIAT